MTLPHDPDEITMRAVLQAMFKCSGCGTCCRICKDIHVTDDDIKKMSMHLGISTRAFRKKYTRRHSKDDKKLSLRNKRACIFFDRLHKSCKIYDSRPAVCRQYPFLDSEMVGKPIGTCFPDCPGQLAAILELNAWLLSMTDEERERCQRVVAETDQARVRELQRAVCRAADRKIHGEA